MRKFILDINPATGELIEKIKCSSPGEVASGVKLARKASKSWHLIPMKKRAHLFKNIAKDLAKEKEKIGELSFIDFWSVKRRFLDMIWKHDRSVWNLGKQEHQLLSRYERDDKKEIAELFDLDPNEAEETTIPAWINSEKPNAVVFPRSIRIILLWMKRHDNKIDIK